MARQHFPSAEPQHCSKPYDSHDLHRRDEGRSHSGALHAELERVFVFSREPLDLVVLHSERLHDPDTGERLLQDRRYVAHLGLDHRCEGPDAVSEPAHHRCDQRNHHKDQRGQTPVHHKKHQHGSNQYGCLRNQVCGAVDQRVLDERHVVCKPGYNLTALPPLVKAQRQPLYMPEERVPQVDCDPLSQEVSEICLAVGEKPFS